MQSYKVYQSTTLQHVYYKHAGVLRPVRRIFYGVVRICTDGTKNALGNIYNVGFVPFHLHVQVGYI